MEAVNLMQQHKSCEMNECDGESTRQNQGLEACQTQLPHGMYVCWVHQGYPMKPVDLVQQQEGA